MYLLDNVSISPCIYLIEGKEFIFWETDDIYGKMIFMVQE